MTKTSQAIKYTAILYAVFITGMFSLYVDTAEDTLSQLQYDLNVSNTAIAIYKAENKRLQERNDELMSANECLIKYSYRDRCLTEAIRKTPLPKLVHEKH